jgi:hypothetical protein
MPSTITSEVSVDPFKPTGAASRVQARRDRRQKRRWVAGVLAMASLVLGCGALALLVQGRGVPASVVRAAQSTEYQAYLACQGVSGDIKAARNDARAAGQRLKPLAVTAQSLGNLDMTLVVVSSAPALNESVRNAYASARITLTEGRRRFAAAGLGGVQELVDSLDALAAEDNKLCTESLG